MNDRRVHFSVPIHKIEYLGKQWETASRQARDGSDWLRMGLDRERFRNRIERTSEILSKIFDLDFRQQVYQERFENFVIPESLSTSSLSETKAKLSKPITSDNQPKTNTTEATTSTIAYQSESQTQSQQTKHNTINKKNKRRRKKRGKNYHRKHRGRH